MNTHGIGLGLHISKQITQAYEGDITFTSEPGVGSVFTFSFQIEEAPEPDLDDVEYNLDSMKLEFEWVP